MAAQHRDEFTLEIFQRGYVGWRKTLPGQTIRFDCMQTGLGVRRSRGVYHWNLQRQNGKVKWGISDFLT
jgi:hypothetical protein